MDSLSFGNIQNLDAKNQQVSFTGQKSIIEETGAQKYRFYAPPFNDKVVDKKTGKEHHYALAVELVAVAEEKDKNGNATGRLITQGAPKLLENSIALLKYGNGTFDVDAKDMQLPNTDMVGYRFVLIDEDELKKNKNLNLAKQNSYLLDSGAVAEGESGKFSYFSKKQGFVNKTGPMYHIFPDAYNVKDNKDFVRNHFNKAGGNIQGIIEKLKEKNSELDPYEMIIFTPLFGADDISSHGYWTMNPYQIASTKGTLEDFKELQNTMFDKGKTYVADGAFTSLSIESPQMQHFLRWGKESESFNWIKFDKTDAPNANVPIGVFPDTIVAKTDDKNSPDYKKAELLKKNIGFKVINPKYIEADGKNRLNLSDDEFEKLKGLKGHELGSQVVKNPNYDKTKPTYIQIIDKRLTDDKQLLDNTKIITKYAKSNTKNHYDMTEHQDSAIPFYFPVNPEDNRFKTKGATLEILDEIGYVSKNGKRRKGYDAFFQMDQYSITRKGEAGGASNWDGNVDLFKANITNPSNDPDNIIGNKQVKNYYYNIASYWTKLTDDSLVEHIAKGVSTNPDKTFQNISKQHHIDKFVLDDIKSTVIHSKEFNKNFKDRVTGKSTEEVLLNSVVDFPLESVEFAPELTAVLSTSHITPRPTNKNDDETLPKVKFLDKMSKNAQNLYKDDMQDYLVSVLSALDVKMPKDQKIFESGNVTQLTDYGKALTGIISSDVMKFGVTKALFKDIDVKFDENGNPEYDENIRYKGISSLGIKEPTAKDEANAVLKKLRSGFKSITNNDTEALVNSLHKRFGKVKLDDIKTARAIIDKTGAGLNWRFDAAKDVADLDQRRALNPHVSFEDCWDSTIDFWGSFIKNIRKQNPASYVIAEVTDLWSFSRWQHGNKNEIAKATIEDFKAMNSDDQKQYIANFFTKDIQKGDKDNVLGKVSPEAKDFINGNTKNLSRPVFNELKNIYLSDDNLAINAVWGKDFGKFIDPNIAERMFYEKTGATTGSNYSTFFGLYPELFGQNYENGNTADWRLYNMQTFQNSLKDFFKSASPQFINGSHIFVNNHDKPRPFHCVALDMELFLGDLKNDADKQRAEKVTGSKKIDQISSMGVAVGEKYLETFEKGIDELNSDSKSGVKISDEEKKIIKQAIGELASGKFLNTPANMNTSRAFGFSPFDVTMKDVMQHARYIAKSKGMQWPLADGKKYDNKQLSNAEQKIIDKAFEQFSPDLDKLGSMFKMMMFSVGVPTIFAGDEMGHSGYETATKNTELAIRNLVHHGWISETEGKEFIKKFYNEVTAAAKVHKNPALSALADGSPLIVPQNRLVANLNENRNLVLDPDGKPQTDAIGNFIRKSAEEKENPSYSALYKYNDKGSNVLVVYSNKQMQNEMTDTMGHLLDAKARAKAPLDRKTEDKIPYIQLGYIDPYQQTDVKRKKRDVNGYPVMTSDGKFETENASMDKTVGNVAKDGEKFKKIKYNPKKAQYEDDGKLYIVEGGRLYSATTVGPNGIKIAPKADKTKPIELDDVANVFYKVS